MKICLCLLLLLLPGLRFAPAAPPPATIASEPPPPPGIEVLHDVVTGQGGDKTLRSEVILPTQPPAHPMPAVLLVHGGGWGAGSPKDKGWISRGFKLSQAGFFVATVDYRLDGEAKWPAQIEDCKLAVRWLRANAAKYNVDPNRIGCWGGSAGGHLVACLGTMDDPALEGTGGYPGVSSKVQAVVDLSGPTDFSDGTFGNGSPVVTDLQKQKDTGMALQLLGVSYDTHPDVWKKASPMNDVAAGDPPFLLIYGDKDPIVSLAQGTAFADALQKAGVPVELEIVKNAGHVGGAIKGGPPPEKTMPQIEQDVVAFFVKTLKP